MGACGSVPPVERLVAPSPFSDVAVLEALGEGSHAKVYRGQCRHSGGLCALKVANGAPKSAALLKEEASILGQLDHPNIAKLLGCGKGPRGPYVAMELCSGGELFEHIEHKGIFSEKEAAHVMRQLLEAVAHMHSNGICHRDLKEDNLLIAEANPVPNEGLSVKVCDFGIARRTGSACAAWSASLCTPSYASPEVLVGEVGDEACDLWSCGVILYTLLCGSRPFGGESCSEVLESVRAGGPRFSEAAWHGVSEGAIGLVQRLLRGDKAARYTANQALAHPWVVRQAPLGEPATARECLLVERPTAAQSELLNSKLDALGSGVLPWELSAALCHAGIAEDAVVSSQLAADAADGNGLLDCSALRDLSVGWPSLTGWLAGSESFGLHTLQLKRFSGTVDLLYGSLSAKNGLPRLW